MTTRINKIWSHLVENKDVSSALAPEQTAGIRVGSLDDIKNKLEAWNKFLYETVPERIAQDKSQRAQASEELTYDVVVVGYGAAGASAALDAADAGKSVLLIDRFDGGGSTRRSGGLYYAGGGTRAQKDAGINDDPQNMFAYLKQENAGAVDDETLMRFCEESPDTFKWLEERVGVPFKNREGKTVYYEKKTSYPPSYVTLNFSGNEMAAPFNRLAKPAPRSNRVFGEYLTGNILFSAFEKSVESHPRIKLLLNTKVSALLMSEDNKACVGVVADSLNESLHSTLVMLHEIGSGSPMLDPKRKIDRRCVELETLMFSEHSTRIRISARCGVIMCTGGFFFNSEMVKQHAPKYDGYMPLGNLGDDGSGINLCRSVGCAVDRMDRCSAWKFTNPPFSFLNGVLVSPEGVRVGNEDTYGATFADFLVQKHGGKGWLIIDQQAWDEANRDCMDQASGLQPDQRMQGLANLHKNRIEATSTEDLTEKLKAPKLAATIKHYNQDCERGIDTQFGKLPAYMRPLKGNLYAICLDMVGNKYWPTPCMTLGGVKVDGKTGLALRTDRSKVNGLYVAGRAAVGIASNYYISGLSVADCVFSGRRAGRHASFS